MRRIRNRTLWPAGVLNDVAGRLRHLITRTRRHPRACAAAILVVAVLAALVSWAADLVDTRADSRSGSQGKLPLIILSVSVVVALCLAILRARRGLALKRTATRRVEPAAQGARAQPLSREDPAASADGDPEPLPRPNASPTYLPKHEPLWNNLISLVGLFLAAISIVLLLTFGLFSLVTPTRNPYVDVVGYLVLPGVLVVGLTLAPLGFLIKSWRLRRRDPMQKLTLRFPRFDLNDPRQRRTAKLFVVLIVVLLPVVVVSGYHGYHYTDSARFCAYACHAVMEPQATAYEHSAHARVSCAACHIGAGASWFFKSKLSGTRQVLATWQDSYPRPIPPAITELRPARETCERCHWPRKFFGSQLREIVHFAPDEKNTRRRIDMLLKTGGGDDTFREPEGIHAHMAFSDDRRIEYVATDERLQEIPWVKMTDKAGSVSIYRSDGRPGSDPPPEGVARTFDCMDCHNRPAHEFRSPEESVDLFLEGGAIDRTLPFIKREAVALLARDYDDATAAEAGIGRGLTRFYRESYPEIWESRRASIYQAIDTLREIYRHSIFPDMRVDWRTYPDNIGHKTSPGCFRCHEGNHVNQHGQAISHACGTCHIFLNPVRANGEGAVVEKGAFVHPIELPGLHARLRCDRCHTGGGSPARSCTGCHALQHGLLTATLPVLDPFAVAPDPMAGRVDCEGCHALDQPQSIQTIDAMCMDCHDEEERFEGLLARRADELARARVRAGRAVAALEARLRGAVGQEQANEARAWRAGARDMLECLDAAGALHNPAASKTILERLTREAGRYTRALEAATSG